MTSNVSKFQIDSFSIDNVSIPWPDHGSGCQCGCFRSQADGDNAAGGEETIQSANAPAGPSLAVISTGRSFNNGIDGILYGQKYATTVITFSFPTSAAVYGTDYSEAVTGFRAASESQAAATDWILTGDSARSGFVQRYGSISSFANLTFVDNGNGDAVIRVAASSIPSTAFSYYPYNGAQGSDVWFGKQYDGTSADYRQVKIGNYAYHTLLHELGHGLGLKHGHESGGPSGVALPADLDSHEFSIMTYRSYPGKAIGGVSNETYGFPQGYMMLDIAALQFMYGANYSTNSGNTTYKWSPITGEMFIDGAGQGAPGDGNGGASNRVFLTIWDGGGNDTYDYSNYTTALNVDLNPGGWSKISNTQLAYLGDGHYARGNVFNALLHQGNTASLIENVVAGTADDIIIGNVLNNRIQGNAGNDTIDGGSGRDTLVLLGNRSDYREFSVSGSTFTIKDSVASRDGTDVFRNVEVLIFRDQDVTVQDFFGVSASTVSPADEVIIFRFLNKSTGTHFYTASASERDSIQKNLPNYQFEGPSFAGTSDAGGDMSIFRFYNRSTGTHFYTASAAEANDVMKNLPNYQYEGTAYKAFSQPTDGDGDAHMALHRFYNTSAGVHFYTADPNEKANVQEHLPNFKYEGVAYYVDAVL
ncbi:protease [Roseomonas hellenica]|uniref:Protease n=1 Tax=Plastoroseomonas hellenica TaxID=2687306 RepID=A0ABS5ES68_9PROT|nr:M10 family metallopeptidase C-terminal domain-containing protein [Plastoroseomonas hellenica]MBR0663123.1 protease [Plastoroseomonas hellenica]